ncbi:MAG: hypothetical protein GF401_07510 [Chitinivibrionales bacterium]|nr:hypothetical protein [Chitinivibrionales bacterium]
MEKTMIDQISLRILERDPPLDLFFVFQKETDEAELHCISLNMNETSDDVSSMVALGDSLDRYREEEGVLMVIDGASPNRHVYAVDFNPQENEIYFFNAQETEDMFDLLSPQIASLAPYIKKDWLDFAGPFPGCDHQTVFSYGSDT